MDAHRVSALIQQLVEHVLSRAASEGNHSKGGVDPRQQQRVVRLMMAIVSSRISSSVVRDEAAVVGAIQRRLYKQRLPNVPEDFVRKHQALAALSGPGSLTNRWALLRLLQLLSEDRSQSGSNGSESALLPLSAAAVGGLPALPLSSSEPGSRPPSRSGANGVAAAQNPPPGYLFYGTKAVGEPTAGVPAARNAPPGHLFYGTKAVGEPTGGALVESGGGVERVDTRAAAIEEYLEIRASETEVAESDLVRDVLFACQGIDGRYVKLDPKIDTYSVDEMWAVPRAVQVLVRRVAELGWLYRRVRGHLEEGVNEHSSMERVGMVGQAFMSALRQELKDYYRLMAVLEAQLHNPIPEIAAGAAANGGETGGGCYLTLRRLSVWLAEPLVRMRLMAVLVDSCKSKKGGAMVDVIHMHVQHGDPFAHSFMSQLLRRVSAPLFEMVRRWVLEGELEDIHGEFFVLAHKDVGNEGLWREGYRMEESMLPSFIPVPLALRILRTGKSINFLRRCCQDQSWAAAASAVAEQASERATEGLEYGETEALEGLVGEAASCIDQHLMRILFDQFKFREHCLAVKRYLLLGQGDLVTHLMDLVEKDLSGEAKSISSFGLAGKLETAIRASNAYYDDADVLDRLRVKMMPHTGGEQGWDVFSLVYQMTPPLTTIFTEAVMTRYLRIFNFLWRLKRVEQSLSDTWREMKPTAAFGRFVRSRGGAKQGVPSSATSGGGGGSGGRASVRGERESSETENHLAMLLRRCQTQSNEMYHFVTNLQYYIMFEVLETSWTNFEEEMGAAPDLDALIAAHDKFLAAIIEKALLGEKSQDLCQALMRLFSHILHFKGLASRLLDLVRDALAQKEHAQREIATRTSAGKWGSLRDDEDHASHVDAALVSEIASGLDRASELYAQSLQEFMAALPLQQHVDLRFLYFRLDFSEFYTRKGKKDVSGTKTPLGLG